MSNKISKNQLKSYFVTGAKPTESNFAELLDNCYNAPRLDFDEDKQDLSIYVNDEAPADTVNLNNIIPHKIRSWVHGHNIRWNDREGIVKPIYEPNGIRFTAGIQPTSVRENVKGKGVLLQTASADAWFYCAIPTTLIGTNCRLSSLYLDMSIEDQKYDEYLAGSKDQVSIETGSKINVIKVYDGRRNITIPFTAPTASDLESIHRIPLGNPLSQNFGTAKAKLPLINRGLSIAINIGYYFNLYSRIHFDDKDRHKLSAFTNKYLVNRFFAIGCEISNISPS
ncbi:MAG: hypothetical protein ACPG5B_04755 [Chitinophagales bacterium]